MNACSQILNGSTKMSMNEFHMNNIDNVYTHTRTYTRTTTRCHPPTQLNLSGIRPKCTKNCTRNPFPLLLFVSRRRHWSTVNRKGKSRNRMPFFVDAFKRMPIVPRISDRSARRWAVEHRAHTLTREKHTHTDAQHPRASQFIWFDLRESVTRNFA